jgi:hypothetical protein
MIVTTTSQIEQSINQVFEHIVPISLPHIFKKFKYFPAVISTNETQKWITPGLVRTVFFEDGNTAQEELITVINPSYFAYTVTNFTSPLRFLITQINGSWEFTQTGNKTNIVWKYELIPRNKFTKWIINNLLLNDLKTFCQNAMDIIQTDFNKKN